MVVMVVVAGPDMKEVLAVVIVLLVVVKLEKSVVVKLERLEVVVIMTMRGA